MELEVDQLRSRSKALRTRFNEGGEMHYIEEAIVLDREALALCPPGHLERSTTLTQLAVHLSDRYGQLGSMQDLNEAILLDREALDLCPTGHTGRSMSLNNLAVHVFTRYRQLGEIQDLNEAIVLDREGLELRPQGHPDRPMSLSNLAAHLSTKYDQLGGIQDLNEAIVLALEACDLFPKGHLLRSSSLNNLALYLSTRYKQSGAIQDLDEAIVLSREVLDLRSKDHPNRSFSLNSLALHLTARYKQFGAMQDIKEAIALGREALELHPKGHPHRSMSLCNIAIRLYTRYNQLGEMQDLNEAIGLNREALDLCEKGQPLRPSTLNSLANCLTARYDQLGTIQDLNEAIVLDRETLDLRPQGHPDRSMSLNNLAIRLSTRYNQLGAIQDLNEAILLDREALDLCPAGHVGRATSLNNLSVDLSVRYNQLGEMEDLDEAILLDREALGLHPKGHPGRSSSLTNLALYLSTRYDKLGAMQDLDDAIVLSREALDLCQKGHPFRPSSLNNLALRLSTRYDQLGEIRDLDEAIVFAQEMLVLCPEGHPHRLESLGNLAGYLCNRFKQSKVLEDKEEAFSHYTQLAHAIQVVSSTDLSAARRWIDAAEGFQHPTLLLAYETSLRFLVQHLATLPSLPQHLVILKDLTSSLAVDAFSACLRNDCPTKAVELLEQGRGVFWMQLIRLRSPLEDVVAFGPEGRILADEFSRLTSRIRNALSSPGEDQHEQSWRLNIEMQKVVTKIRELPGLSRFLLPSLFCDLKHAAKGGPVIVVNASKHGCDALIISLDRDPVHIALQIKQGYVRDLAAELSALARRATRGDATKQLAIFLRKLWDQIVLPIVDVLRTIHSAQSRIWWCPTAEFTHLPLHAAGPFRKGQQNLPDLYISSYTPTLTALILAKQPHPSHSASEQKHFLAIGQGNAIGESELPSVSAELDTIAQRMSGLATFTRVDGEESCIARVTEELSKTEWVHLSCHGLPMRTQPFESAFALRDGHFTIQRIIECDLKNPEFAYLSACHTTVGYEGSADEVIHLASAMQFAGFRSVIGTMWAVDDGETNKITSTFYRLMVDESGRLDHARAAYALNKTMRSVNIPFDQKVLYIHLGA